MNDERAASTDPLTEGRPDPHFKLLTTIEAEEAGLLPLDSELQVQQTTRTDLILAVLPDSRIEGTMFDFFRAVNVLEFKSLNDQFNRHEYHKNEVRTTLKFLQSGDPDIAAYLNVIVTARLPRKFLVYAALAGVPFGQTEGRPWLWRAQVGFQSVAIVVCRDLPVEERYYTWLAFAPSGTVRWKTYMLRLLREQEKFATLLSSIRRVRPKEYRMSTEVYRKALEEMDAHPEMYQPVEPSSTELLKIWIEEAGEEEAADMIVVRDLLIEKLTPEQRLAGLEPEQRLAGLTPEEKAGLLKLLQADVPE